MNAKIMARSYQLAVEWMDHNSKTIIDLLERESRLKQIEREYAELSFWRLDPVSILL